MNVNLINVRKKKFSIIIFIDNYRSRFRVTHTHTKKILNRSILMTSFTHTQKTKRRVSSKQQTVYFVIYL